MATRTLPKLDAINRFFWTSGADEKLRFLRCSECQTFVHPPQPLCHECLSEAVEPTVVPGSGVIDTFTINHQKWRPDLTVPYVIARIAIDGAPGVFLTSNVVEAPPEGINIGDRVRVRFLREGDVYLPLFEKVV